ncbi:MAG: TRAP transporter fused permease subunit [Vicinamibacteria bacterium]
MSEEKSVQLPEDAEEAMVRRVQNAPPAATVVAIALSLMVLAGEVTVIETLRFRAIVLGLGISLAFLTLKPRASWTRSVPYGLALLSLGISLGIAAGGRGFLARASEPTSLDLAMGLSLLALVVAGAWVSTGAALPVLSLATMAYVLWGGELDRVGLSMIAHRGYDIERLVGSMVMGFEGVFGVPLDVAATTIGLFAIYGAVLEASGAAQFFLDLSFATFSGGNSARGAGRAVTLAGFLLGSVSGSGVATTLTLGGASAPLLKRAGFSRENSGALLAAAGIGAILSPPTLGAAAFLIAEFLKISYGQVLVMAIIPTLLYYFGILLMIEADVPKDVHNNFAGGQPLEGKSLGTILRTGGHHLLSPLLIVVFLMGGYSATRSAFLAACAAAVLSYVNRAQALTPARLRRALISAGATLVPVIATTACAGILVAGLTLTGLGLKVAGLIVSLAGSNATGVILLSAVSVSVLGLSVPVTASYILSAVTIAPALIHVGVNELAGHMFIFYYAVLSEVSPPTALSPMAAATICHGDPYRTVLATLRYTLPAFLVPLVFTMHPDGLGLLLQAPWTEVAMSTTLAVFIVVAASAAASGYFLRSLSILWRAGYGVAAALLLFSVGPWRFLGVVAFVLATFGSRDSGQRLAAR